MQLSALLSRRKPSVGTPVLLRRAPDASLGGGLVPRGAALRVCSAERSNFQVTNSSLAVTVTSGRSHFSSSHQALPL